jgi:hypothetical protein
VDVGLLATLVHTAGYLAVTLLLAGGVRAAGLRVLRTAWVNLGLVWAVALIGTAVPTAVAWARTHLVLISSESGGPAEPSLRSFVAARPGPPLFSRLGRPRGQGARVPSIRSRRTVSGPPVA